MSNFTADFHVHSKYSRATSKSCDLEGFYRTGLIKGLDVIGTGDFTHPAWYKELNSKLLINPHTGLYLLKDEYKEIKGRDINFILTAEISCIYKKGDKVRKIHSVIFAPNLEAVSKINKRLDAIGNIKSDGRPILGLDVRNLLEIVLEASPDAFLVPAHIWTPWFSIFGDKSGFDTVEEAFDDLSSHIFALETGLSSDPEMNWRLSSLDKYSLISNSDCHSPSKLAREANIFDTDISYDAIRSALKTKDGFSGTIEFFPEEGKYHYDGHRACNISLEPEESLKLGNICPVCGKKLTIGTMHRVLELSDRPRGFKPEGAKDFKSLIPLEEVVGEILNMGVASKAVKNAYQGIINAFESELFFLNQAELSDIKSSFGDVMFEAVKRMREGRVKTRPGYDGEYGKIFLFDQGEVDSFKGQKGLFGDVFSKRKSSKKSDAVKLSKVPEEKASIDTIENEYTKEQEEIINTPGNIRVISGPGSGKTHTLTGRIKRLLAEGKDPQSILVLTFTRKTKAELSSRINGLTEKAKDINISTFHSFGYDVLKKEGLLNKIIDEKEATEIISSLTGKGIKEAKKIYSLISLYRQSGTLHLRDEYPDADLTLRAYIDYKNDNELFDSDDLISVPRAFLKRKGTLPYQYIFIDEFQDLNSTQFELLKVLFEHLKEVFAIGDFDQSIYSFRGADFAFFSELESTLENLKTMTLSMTFRCPENIIKPAFNLIKNNIKRYDYNLVSASKNEGNLYHYTALNDYDEAVFIASKIKEYIGSYGLSEDAKTHDTKYFFGDFAVLARTNFMLKKISEVFDKRDIPYTILKEGEFESPLAIRLYDYFKTFLSAKEKKQALMFDDMSFGGNYFDNIRLKSFLGDIFKNHNDIQSWEKEIFNDLAISATSVEDYVYNISVALKNLVASPKSQNVSLLTLHAAKGLEFKKVFIAGVNHGIIPYSLKGDVDIEEERRLFYVGLTRAKEDVYLLSASKRFIYGNTEDSMPSVFLKELGKKLPSPEIIKKNNRVKVCQLELFGRNN